MARQLLICWCLSDVWEVIQLNLLTLRKVIVDVLIELEIVDDKTKIDNYFTDAIPLNFNDTEQKLVIKELPPIN